MNIYVDADACPMKEITIELGTHYDVPIFLVKSYAHYSLQTYPKGVETIYVDSAKEAADYRILSLAKTGDLIISQDYGLAALALAKQCLVIHPTGFRYTNDNIDRLLTTRHQSAQIRKQGGRTKGPKPLSDHDFNTFTHLLTEILTQTVN